MDPLLASLQYGDLPIFDLTRNLPSISVRDQMVRASMLSRALPIWLKARNKGSDPTLPVLVVGGGACGITAAIQLAKSGIEVEVVDPSSAPFEVQRNCQSRWLDVLQYDWPMDHWKASAFPWHRWLNRSRDAIPLRSKPARSDTLVRDVWDPDLAHHLKQPYGSRIRFHWGRALFNQPAIDIRNNVVAFLKDNQPRVVYWGTYAAIIIAFGFGVETCRVDSSPSFLGYAFWETDHFEDPTYGGQIALKQDTVLISGTSDGGLQDFLRVMTRQPSARTIFDDLNLATTGVRLDRLHSLEHRLERASAWEPPRHGNANQSPYPFTRQPYWAERHEDCLREVRRILTKRLQARVIQYVADRPQRLVLVSQFSYFNCLYVLNQFLALLIIESLRLHPSSAVHSSLDLLMPAEVTNIKDVGHPPIIPPPAAQQCIGRPWDVTVSGVQNPIRANVLIIRHGIRRSYGVPSHLSSPHAYPRPLPPTHLY